MKNLILSSVLVLIASSAAQAQQAVQWRVQDGGNGHWYLLVALPGQGTTRIPWGEARSRSEAIGGHLATLTTAEESAFLWTNFNSLMIDNVWGSPWCCWLGGYRVSGQTFAWVTNEPYSCSVLCGSPCEGGGEDALYTGQTGGPEFCVDFHGSTFQGGKSYYLVEFAQDCNNDGIVDYGQCRDGSLPDCCESGTPCVVGNYPVQWRVAEGGNGHWYQLVISGSVTWEAARSASVLRGGHLATPTSLSERNCLVDVASRPEAWIEHCCGLVNGPWLGGYQPADATSASSWRWVTGEPWSWTDWAPGEPNNGLQPNILSIQMWGGLPLGSNYFGWADSFATGTSPQGAQYILPLSYLIEWSADCNGDDIVDYGQILSGALVDANNNGVPDVCEVDPCPGDITNGGTVDATDLSIVLAAWGTNGQGEFQADIDNSGLVDGGDLALVLSGWGPCPQ